MLRLLQDRSVTGQLISLSTGDFDGEGSVRIGELKQSCEVLGISEDRCLALDYPDLPDDPNLWWPAERIRAVVEEYVERWNVDLIITFDSYGVSGHANHRAVSEALSHTTLLPPTYQLLSTPLALKYLSILSLPYSYLLNSSPSRANTSIFLSSPMQYMTTREAFNKHESQARWFRSLFITFSRYLWFGELKKVDMSQV